MFDGSEGIFVGFRFCRIWAFRFTHKILGVFPRHTVNPFVVGYYRASQTDAVLLDDIAHGLHTAFGDLEIRNRVAATALFPFLPPISQSRAKVTKALEGV